jgi:hypothetical protein
MWILLLHGFTYNPTHIIEPYIVGFSLAGVCPNALPIQNSIAKDSNNFFILI